MIVRRVAVDVVQHEREGEIKPGVGSAADGTATRLRGGEIEPYVVIAGAAGPHRLTGLQPALRTGVAPRGTLTPIAAVQLLAFLRKR